MGSPWELRRTPETRVSGVGLSVVDDGLRKGMLGWSCGLEVVWVDADILDGLALYILGF